MGSSNTRHKQPTPNQATPAPAIKQTPRPQISNKTTDTKTEKKKYDIMISYSHQDVNMMHKVHNALQKEDISVWVDENALAPGAVFLREIGEAIVASKLFIVLLSKDSVTSKYCQDEVSLAYISNKDIFALSLLPYDEIAGVMDLGMRLTLSCVQWTFLNENPDQSLSTFVSSVKSALAKVSQETVEHTGGDTPARSDESTDEDHAPNLVMNRQAFKFRLQGKHDSTLSSASIPTIDSDVSAQFWESNFGNVKVVDWDKFTTVMKQHMESMWSQFSVSQDTIKHLITLMAKEMDVVNNKLLHKNYMLFCTKGKEVLALDEAIGLFAAAAVAVREVFQIDSSVRLTAIENLGDHKSKAVINVLLDLLYDENQDVRVVAAISLAHAASEIKKPKTRSEVMNGLLSCLSNDDRLVRESGCLALGRMKSKIAIKKLVYLWRNDYISTVREAAQIAIHQIGGDEAEQAIHITRVLGEEIQKLKTNE